MSSSIPPPVRRLAAGLVSLVVLLAAGWYVIAPTGIATELSVREMPISDAVGDLVPISYVATRAARPRTSVVLYGTISAPDEVDVTQAVLRIVRRSGRVVARVSIGPRTSYRSTVHLKPRAYRFVLSVRIDGRQRSASSALVRVRDGKAYQVSLRARRTGVVTMLPVTSY